jgi:hypothetical protein
MSFRRLRHQQPFVSPGLSRHTGCAACSFLEQAEQSVNFQLPHDALRLHPENPEPMCKVIEAEKKRQWFALWFRA